MRILIFKLVAIYENLGNKEMNKRMWLEHTFSIYNGWAEAVEGVIGPSKAVNL